MANKPEKPDVITSPPPSDRTRATRLRAKVKVGAPLSPDEAAWLNDYESAREEKQQSRGASHRRVTEYREEESSAVGTGTAAEVAAAAAMAREEGRRYDHLLDGAIRALTTACTLHEKMASTLLERAIEDGNTVRALLGAYRESTLEKTELEAEAIRAAAEAEGAGGELGKLAETLLPVLMQKMQLSSKKKTKPDPV